jgi:S-adenosylmethionine:tRNA ribosyltransferase-isomerase
MRRSPEFELPAALSASEPPEARGVPRDGVRMLVARPGGLHHAHFRDLPTFLRPGDLLVVNTSATLPAAVDGTRDGMPITVHFSTDLGDGSWVVELRPPGRATGPVHDATAGERIQLPSGAVLTLLASHPDGASASERLWRGNITTGPEPTRLMRDHGRPIAYSYVPGRWPLADYQTIFAREPGSAEMPSAARPFTPELVTRLIGAGVMITPLTLHTGVSSPEKHEPPLVERYHVPGSTARLVNLTRRSGGRVIAVGTTVTRALETVAASDGTVTSGNGWTDLLLNPDRPARAVDGLITGWHEPGTSHLRLLQAVAGAALVAAAYDEALRHRYLWHEFGDTCLLLPR